MEDSIKEGKKQTKNANLVTVKTKTVKLHTLTSSASTVGVTQTGFPSRVRC